MFDCQASANRNTRSYLVNPSISMPTSVSNIDHVDFSGRTGDHDEGCQIWKFGEADWIARSRGIYSLASLYQSEAEKLFMKRVRLQA